MRRTDTPTAKNTATRRRLLALIGAGTVVPLAGCGGSSSGDDGDPENQESGVENDSEDEPGNSTATGDDETGEESLDAGDDGTGEENPDAGDGGCPELPLSYTTLETSGFDPGLQFDVPANWTDEVEMPTSLDGYESTLRIIYPPAMESERWGVQFTFQMHDPNTEGFENPREVGVDGVAGNFLEIDVDDEWIETTSEYDRDTGIYTRIVRNTSQERLHEIVIFPYGDRVLEVNGSLSANPENTDCPDAVEAVYRRVVNTIRPAE